MADLLQGRLFRVLLLGAAFYALFQTVLPVPLVILIENGLALSIAGGVAVIYAPIALHALLAPRPMRGHFLGLGIFVSWTAQFGIRVLAIFVSSFGYLDVLNSRWRTMLVALMLLGGLLHLIAPTAESGEVDRSRWIIPGIVFGIGVFVVFLLASLPVPP